MSQHLPNIAGCAIGFAAAGSGIGSLVGMCLHPLFWPPTPEIPGDPNELAMALYGGVFRGIFIGMAIGMFTGIIYAIEIRLIRRQRRE